MKNTTGSGPTDPTTPCDKCGGGTYTFPSGSIWCPSETAHPGGHFVKRVAFERPPARDTQPRLINSQSPQRKQRIAQPRPATVGTSEVTTTKPKDNGFDTGFDGFIGKDKS